MLTHANPNAVKSASPHGQEPNPRRREACPALAAPAARRDADLSRPAPAAHPAERAAPAGAEPEAASRPSRRTSTTGVVFEKTRRSHAERKVFLGGQGNAIGNAGGEWERAVAVYHKRERDHIVLFVRSL